MGSLQVLDCTIRDGGLVNDWFYSMDTVSALVQVLSQSNISKIEIGYRSSTTARAKEKNGPWCFCEESILGDMLRQCPQSSSLGVMIDIGREDLNSFLPKKESFLDFVRVACYVKQLPEAIRAVQHLHQLGYQTTINLMAISISNRQELREALRIIRHNAPFLFCIPVVDSFGSMTPSDVKQELIFYKDQLGDYFDVGFHGHNNLQLAFANTLTAIQYGATIVDSTVLGMGRGAGNCPTELLLGHLHGFENLESLLNFIQNYFLPLKNQYDWGYSLPYMLSGLANCHPRDAITWRHDHEKKDCCLDFYQTYCMNWENNKK